MSLLTNVYWGPLYRFMKNFHGGYSGLYRGMVPGTLRSFFSNGASMIVMSWAQKKVTEMGLRG